MPAPDDVRSGALDPVDARILRALQIAPRASFAAIAAATGTGETAVARRYRRLVRRGVVRVVGVLDPGALGQSRWIVRLRCRPGAVAAVADALARRDDVSWVSTAGAGAEVLFAVRSRTSRDREDLLLNRLPHTDAVLDLQASVVLHQFTGGRARFWQRLAGTLGPEAEAALGAAGPPFDPTAPLAVRGAGLSAEDEAVVAALALDGRAGRSTLAAAAGTSRGRAARRLDALLASGTVRVDVEISPAALGLDTRAALWLRVHPASVEDAGRALALEPATTFVAAVTGAHNLHAVVHCRDLEELWSVTSQRVGQVPGVETLEVAPLRPHVKQIATRVDGDRLADVED